MTLLELAPLIIDFRNRGCDLRPDPIDERAFTISAPHLLTPIERRLIDTHARQVLIIVREGLDVGIEVLTRLQRCRSYTLRGRRFIVLCALAEVLRDAGDFAAIVETLRRFEIALIELGGRIDFELADTVVGEN
jgi:hypothetical protein